MFSNPDKNYESTEKAILAESGPADSPRDHDRRNLSCSYVAPTVHIEGQIIADGGLSVEGEVEGTIRSKRGQVIIGEHSRIAAEIHASIVDVRGTVEGDIHGREMVHLYPTAVVDGTMHCARIVVDDGAGFNGTFAMPKTRLARIRGKLLANISAISSRLGAGLFQRT